MTSIRNVSIGSMPFIIEEEAYQLLDNYLFQIGNRLPFSEKSEILEDVENRLAEIFSSRINSTVRVISLKLANEAIAIIGSAEEFGESQSGGSTINNQNPNRNGSWCGFYRSTTDKVFGGVCGGLALYLQIDPKALRIVLVILTVVTASILLWIYLAAWLIVPDDTKKLNRI